MFIREAEEIYRYLWLSAEEAFQQGELDLDPHLSDLENDLRRGITLVAWPSQPCVERFSQLADELKEILPGQYFYDPQDYHITILTLIDAYAGFDLDDTPIELYDRVLTDVLPTFPPFEVDFRGICVTPGTIMVQGHLRSNTVNEMRDALRQALGSAGLGDSLDSRYENVTAHSVIARFKGIPDHPEAVFRQLTAFRQVDLGTSVLDTVYLMLNDWYMSHEKVRTLHRYPLENVRPSDSG